MNDQLLSSQLSRQLSTSLHYSGRGRHRNSRTTVNLFNHSAVIAESISDRTALLACWPGPSDKSPNKTELTNWTEYALPQNRECMRSNWWDVHELFFFFFGGRWTLSLWFSPLFSNVRFCVGFDKASGCYGNHGQCYSVRKSMAMGEVAFLKNLTWVAPYEW